MDKMVRTLLIIVGMLSLFLAVGFCLQLPWTVWLWLWADSFSPYLFLGAITAATAASLLWIGLSGELGAAAGGALHLTVFYGGLAGSLFLLFQRGGDQNLLARALVCGAAALASITLWLWFRRYHLRDSRPLPLPVRISFGMFVVVLVLAGSGILLQVPNVFAWKLRPTSASLLGWFFLGAACYFLYGLVRPAWRGQLWAFLSYDLVLIVPYLLHFALARPEQLPSLFINTLVLLYSAALAIYYLLIKRTTRRARKRRQNPPAEELCMDEHCGPNATVAPAQDGCASRVQSKEGVMATAVSSKREGISL